MDLKEMYRTLWLNLWHFARTEDSVKSHLVFSQLSTEDSQRIFKQEKDIFYRIEYLFNQGKLQGIFKPLDNKVLSCISLESSTAMARKQRNNCFQVDDQTIELVINASWDALLK
jgi:TetR/AcrR family transcriptional repressor of multidrug resistance operon